MGIAATSASPDTLADSGMREVLMAREVGFCFGVKRAIGMAQQALDQTKPVYILGDLVHNRKVTDDLESKGLRKTASLAECGPGTMIVRAHGLPQADLAAARSKGLELVDATCPIVHRAQEAARSLEQRNCQVLIVGDRNHAEIKGILGSLRHPALVVDSVSELRELHAQHRLMRKVGVVFQTTHALELCRQIIDELLVLCKEVQVINTICRPVKIRQDDAVELARTVELMIVVGSRSSANTAELAALCRLHNPQTIHVQEASELTDADLVWARRVGIASGLSTPDHLVEAVFARIRSLEAPVQPELRPALAADPSA